MDHTPQCNLTRLDAVRSWFLPQVGTFFLAVCPCRVGSSLVGWRWGRLAIAAAPFMIATIMHSLGTMCSGAWTKIVNEETLVERCRRGDREAQRELYDRTADRINRLLLRMTGNQDDALDLAQEAYLKGFAQIDRFDGRSTIATWFHRIALNEALQFLRRIKTTRIRTEGLSCDEDHRGCDADTTTVQLDFRAALAQVEPADRAILLLRYQEGLGYRTIGEILECAEGTVASRLSRARDRLRGLLRESYGLREVTDATVHPKSRR